MMTRINFLRSIAVALVALCFPLLANAQRGESCFGVQTGFTSTNTSAIAGLFYQYGISNSVRIAPEIGCVFRHKDLDAFTMDVNVHFPLNITSSATQLYPLAGINYSSWNRHNVHHQDTNDVNSRSNKIGVNLGAGFQFKASSTLKLKVEAKYTLTSHFSTFVLGVGLGYCF